MRLRPEMVDFDDDIVKLNVVLAPLVRLEGLLPPPEGAGPSACPPPEHPAININPAVESAERRALFPKKLFLVG